MLVLALCLVVVVMTDITDLYRQIHTAELNVTGASCKDKRTTLLRGATLDISRDSGTFRHLLSLRRSLKVHMIFRSAYYGRPM